MMKVSGIMVQGTGSSVGKSILAAALCRILAHSGKRVAPFKSQNMALNSYVTSQGGEIGMAQALQADAAFVEPTTDMNPVLLKPVSEKGSQIIIHGKAIGNMEACQYYAFKDTAWSHAVSSFNRLAAKYDCIIAEGAGSPAEINLAEYDICNMKVAELGDMPVLLVADIDKGGVFAQIVGTLELLTKKQKDRVAGLIINKFRGDISLLQPGIDKVEQITGKKVLGVIPYIKNLCLEEEDSTAIEADKIQRKRQGIGDSPLLKTGIVRLPHISNFSDFLPMQKEVELTYIFRACDIKDMDCIIIPGSKSTISDLEFLKKNGIAERIVGEYKAGRSLVFGICGGFQMLGDEISDPLMVESKNSFGKGLSLLAAKTIIQTEKKTNQTTLFVNPGSGFPVNGKIDGYEIHMGQTTGSERPLFVTEDGNTEGMLSSDGCVFGTYIHGIFSNDNFRKGLYETIAARIKKERGNTSWTIKPFNRQKQDSLDSLALTVKKHLDMEAVLALL